MVDLRNLVEKSFDDQVEDTKEEAWEFDAETLVDQKKTVATARPCKCLGLLLLSNLTFIIFV